MRTRKSLDVEEHSELGRYSEETMTTTVVQTGGSFPASCALCTYACKSWHTENNPMREHTYCPHLTEVGEERV